MAAATETRAGEALPFRTKFLYAFGDHAINLCLSSLLFLFPAFLTEVAGLRPALAGLVPLIGRFVDAFSDPAMGRISDGIRWKAGRRRPFFLIGMVPLGLAYGSLWWAFPAEGASQFAYYATAYALFSLASTVVAVPYLSLIPEMTASYDERTSVNAFRGVGAILGSLLAAGVLPGVVAAFGGGSAGYQSMGIVAGLYVIAPWVLVYAVTFERRDFQRPTETAFFASLGSLIRHRSYMTLMGLFLLGRIAIDMTSSMFLLYFTYHLGRPEDFQWTMFFLLATVAIAIPGWSAVSRRTDKRTIFLFGAAWWIASMLWIYFATPEWPRWVIFVGAMIAGVGYAAADLIPWSMLGEVVDEDELSSGERREGLYFGVFTFLRKLGGALGVAGAYAVLDLAGYVGKGQDPADVPVDWIIAFSTLVPAVFVFLAAIVALGYPLGRERHAEILRELEQRRSAREGA